MSSHASADLLSAYIDRQLIAREAQQLEEHLETCQQCNVRLEGLRKVVASLQSTRQLAPPSTLEQTVKRQIALVEDRPSLLDHFEQGMSLLNRQNPILAMFGVVVALMLFIYLFSYTLYLRENSSIEVTFQRPPAAVESATEGLALGSQLTFAGRQLVWSEGGLWVEEGLRVGDVGRTVAIDSDAGHELLAERPQLATLSELGHSVVLRIDGEVVRLD